MNVPPNLIHLFIHFEPIASIWDAVGFFVCNVPLFQLYDATRRRR
jgi:hypothetical protein